MGLLIKQTKPVKGETNLECPNEHVAFTEHSIVEEGSCSACCASSIPGWNWKAEGLQPGTGSSLCSRVWFM